MTENGSWASSVSTRAVMQSNRGKDTRPELALRRELHRRGLRYRVGYRPLETPRRTVDVAFTRRRVAVLVDGCYWHGCPEHYRPARTNARFWSTKITANRERDADTTARLVAAGWTVMRFWEHEGIQDIADRVEASVRDLATVPESARDEKGWYVIAGSR